MKLSYPNPCRSFDASHRRDCFWGYDSTIEISFYVGTDAFKWLCMANSYFMRQLAHAEIEIFQRVKRTVLDLC